MDAPQRETVRLGDDLIPGSHLVLSWDEVREMQRSGLVEFAAHSYNLHSTHLATPQGTELPAGASLAYMAETGYETPDAYRERIRRDLERIQARIKEETGVAPRAMVWPFGRYTQAGEEEALAAGYEFLLTLDPEIGFPVDLPNVPRLYPIKAPDLPSLLTYANDTQPSALRLVRLNPADLSASDPVQFEKNLGAAIERVRILGATHVIVEAGFAGPGDRLEAVWFPNRVLPIKADVLSRIVWQVRTRAGVQVAVSLPATAALNAAKAERDVIRLFEDLGASVLADALFLTDAPALAAIPTAISEGAMPWDIRHERDSLDVSKLPPTDALALRAFYAFDHTRPGRRLFLLTQSVAASPSAVANLTLVGAPLDPRAFRKVVDSMVAAKWMEPPYRYRSGVWIRAERPPSATALSPIVRLFQRRGGVTFGWEPDDPVADEPKAAAAAPDVSAAKFSVLR